jgi:hypothetical protein
LLRADLVVRATPEAAFDAAGEVGSGDNFAPFREPTSAFGEMGHFPLPAGGLSMMQEGGGMELGRFRLWPGVTEEVLRAAHTRMIESHLPSKLAGTVRDWQSLRMAAGLI